MPDKVALITGASSGFGLLTSIELAKAGFRVVATMSGRNNIWVVSADGGFPTQLTVSDQRQMGITWSPDGKWIAYQSDYDGDEQWDIFLVSPKTGKVVNLTQTRDIAELSPTWSPDGRYLAYEVKPKTSAAYEIDIYDMAVREGAVNAVLHGNAYAQDKKVTLAFERTGDELVITIRDQGKGMDLSKIPNPLAPENLLKTSGRGIFLMRSFMDVVEIRPSSTGTELKLIKHVHGPTAGGKEASQ